MSRPPPASEPRRPARRIQALVERGIHIDWAHGCSPLGMTIGAVTPPSTLETDAGEIEALRREIERLRVLASRDRGLIDAILRHSPHGIIVCNRHGQFTVQNHAAELIWGGSATAHTVHDWSRYRAFHGDGRPYSPEDWAMARCLTHGEATHAEEVRIQRFDGTLGVLIGSCAPIRTEAGEVDGAVSVFADVTRLKQVEAELARRERELAALAHRSAARAQNLLEVSAALSQSLTREQVALVLVQKGAAAIGAKAAMVGMITADARELELIASAGYPHEIVRHNQRVSLAAELPVNDAIRERTPVLLGSLAERVRAYPHLEGSRDLIGLSAMAMLPLIVQGRCVGALGFHFAHDLTFDEDERAVLGVLAGQCAQALERARLFEQERLARREAEAAQRHSALLYELTAAVNHARTLADVYRPALDTVQRALGVERASILLFDADGVMRFKASRGLSDEYRSAVEGHSPWSTDTRDPVPIFVADVEKDASMQAYLPVFRRERIAALAFVPLVHQRLLGKFMIYCDSARVFSAQELQLAEVIAAHVAQAVARQHAHETTQRLYADAERARQLAEDAVRARENLLAIVSHDLRNPLSAITVSASRLGDQRETDRRHAEVIRRSALRMQRLIDDLLDLAALDAGTLRIQTAAVSLSVLLGQAGELLQPLAAEKQQALSISVEQDVQIEADQDRLLQVLSNVIGNAVKFTPVGGNIAVVARHTGGVVEVAVADDGPGIAEADMPHIFERYWQARPAGRRGIGLGLSIAKGIVEAHGGTIAAARSPVGGALIRFTLQVAPTREERPGAGPESQEPVP